MTRHRSLALAPLVALFSILNVNCDKPKPEPGKVKDEAMLVGVDGAHLKVAGDDYFHDMDAGSDPLGPDEIAGRNTWIVWTGGDDRLWDIMSKTTVGALDFLKTLSSYRGLKFSRDNRWQWLGLVNEPCFEKATGPDEQRFGLWLDKRSADCPKDPFEDETKYPGIKIGARGRKDLPGKYKELPVGSLYGYATGVVGLRLLPNPDFDDAAAKNWDPVRFYEDPNYYLSKDLVKPYRVGMSCGFCHVGPNPTRPPADPEHPKWENLSSNVGAQYFWTDRIFSWQADPSSFVFQFFQTYRPGALDTSLISTDNINNPRTMNAIYNLGSRLEHSSRWGKETLKGGGLNNKQFNDFLSSGPLTTLYQKPDTVWTPRVLKDGSDSVGALGALNRVFLNIGLFSEEWLLHFNPVIGGKPTTAIEIAVNRQNSAYWQATEAQTFNLAKFFLKSTKPHLLKDAPGHEKYLTEDQKTLTLGKTVFAERCARCHSSKLPPAAPGLDPTGCNGSGYLDCWNKYWAWTKTDEFKKKMKEIVLDPKFLDGNYLSSELRVPVTLLETNACSPLATNAIAGNIWDNFSSQSYKDLPSVGTITVYHPLTGEPRQYVMPAGGRGYTRPASLISVWSTAPYLLNNSVGTFQWTGSVDDRMKSFQNSIEQMLWPEKREYDEFLGNKVPGKIDRTTDDSYLRVATGYLPDFLQPLVGIGSRWLPSLFGEGGIEIGPIPKGTPVNLLTNLNLISESSDPAARLENDEKLVELLLKVKHALKALPEHATHDEAVKVLTPLADPLLEFSKCPDFVVNRGHYFGTDRLPKSENEPGLSDDEKRALIAFVKTF
jgi:hypothetical protein